MPELRIHPFARFFDFKAQDEDDAADENTTTTTTTHTSWFFIAMSFHIPKTTLEASGGGHNVDLTHVIQEFAFIVDHWDQRHSGAGHMDLQIDHLRREEIPKWVVESTDGVQQQQQQDGQLSKKQKKRMMSGGIAAAAAMAVALEDPKCFSDDDTPHARKNGFTQHGKRAKSAPTSATTSASVAANGPVA